MNEFFAGTAIVDISPEKGIELAGYPHFPRYNTGIHDPLYASCLYLNDSQTQIAIVTLDLLYFSKKYVTTVRQRIQEKEGIPASNIMISCSHTHSGPWASGRLDSEALLDGLKEDDAYVDSLITKIIDIIAEAKNNSFKAAISFGKEYCGKEQGVGGNRLDPNGPCDPYVYVVAVKDGSGVIRIIMVNYALHPTVIHEDSTLVTADYPCYVRKVINENYPEAIVLFAQGTSGNQSTRYFRKEQSFNEAERIGRTIGSCAVKAVNKLSFIDNIKIKVAREEMPILIRPLPSRIEAEKQVHEARVSYEQKVKEGAPYIEVQDAYLKLLGAENLLGYMIMIESGRKIDLIENENPAEIQVIAFDGLKLIGLPGEIFVEFGLDIKKQIKQISDDLVIINELSNGCLPGYVCTEEAYNKGGYEANTSLLDPKFGYELVEKTVELVREIV